MMDQIILRGKTISQDSNGLYSLTDVWQLSKKGKHHKPAKWLSFDATQELIRSCNKKIPIKDLFVSRPGRGTYGCFKIIAAYAEYLDSDFHVEVLDAFERVFKNDPLLSSQIFENSSSKDQKWIETRNENVKTRNSFTDELKERKVHTWGYGYATNQGYLGMHNKKAVELKMSRGLTKRSNLRDCMTTEELAAVTLYESLSIRKIQKNDIYGNRPCGKVVYDIASGLKDFMDSI